MNFVVLPSVKLYLLDVLIFQLLIFGKPLLCSSHSALSVLCMNWNSHCALNKGLWFTPFPMILFTLINKQERDGSRNHLVTYLFTCLFYKYLVSACHIPDTVSFARDKAMNKTDICLCLHGA